MKNSFKYIAENPSMTRKFGGYKTGVADPYITGYHFIFFNKLPNLTPYTEKTPAGKLDGGHIQKLLSGLCMSVTPPGGTLNKVEFTGLGGVKWAVPGNIDYGNTVSIKFTEMQGLPITSIMHSWVKMIRDYRYGVTSPDGANLSEGNDFSGYSKDKYSATMYYWTTAPDGVTIEYYACYDGMFPSKDPQDLFSSDVETIGKLDVEIEFNVDYAWHEDWVKTNITGIMGQVAPRSSLNTTVGTYGEKDNK